jgi:hypothetical protein
MVKLPIEVTTWTCGEATGFGAAGAPAAAASAARPKAGKAAEINPTRSTSCFMFGILLE